MYRAILIEDEEQARNFLRKKLEVHFPEISIVAEAANVQDAVDVLQTEPCDVLFLDVQLGDGTGFTVLKALKKIDFQVVFVTAFDRYALDAFKHNAVAYVLKPVDVDELVPAVRKALSVLKQTEQLQELLQQQFEEDRLVLHTAEGIHIFKKAEIIRLQSEVNYTRVFVSSGEALLIAKTLKEFEEQLMSSGFERVHQSHVVNKTHIRKYLNRTGGHLIMSDQSEVPVSKRKKTDVLAWLSEG